MYEALSPFARNLIAQAIEGIGPDGPVDHHLHIAGLGTTPGIWLHPDYRSRRHPFRALRANFLLRAGGMRTRRNADAEYLDHLFQTVERSGLGGSYLLYALDWRYERPPGNREPNKDKTELFVDNSYVIDAAVRFTEKAAGSARFIPVASVHPYRPDALEALTALAARGVRHVKWLPPAQNIDPADPMLRMYYRALRQCGLLLLSHTGDEHTLRSADSDQELANPLRLKLAVEEGVVVVMLHAGREGTERVVGPDGAKRTYAERFLEMMETHRENLFGEISALPYLGTHTFLRRLLDDPGVVNRLVNGSDYPAPAIPGIDPTRRLLREGYLGDPNDAGAALAKRRREALQEIRRYNPLLFDFVLKRTMRVNGRRLPASVFQSITGKLDLHGADSG